MKRIIKPFNLEAAKKGAKLEIRNGGKAEILKWDANSSCPLIGFYVDCEGNDSIGSWTLSGKWGGNTSLLDLVIVEYEDEKVPEVGGISAEPKLETRPRREMKVNSDDYNIELVDCNNGIFCHVHDLSHNTEDFCLVYKREEQEQMFGKLLLNSVRDKMNADLCNKVRIEMKIFSER